MAAGAVNAVMARSCDQVCAGTVVENTGTVSASTVQSNVSVSVASLLSVTVTVAVPVPVPVAVGVPETTRSADIVTPAGKPASA